MIDVDGVEVGIEDLRDRLVSGMAELAAARLELDERRAEIARLEQELEETNQGVVALYAELEEQAERLREANATKSRFLSNVSHEFRTPLNSIRALSRMLLERTDGELTDEQEKQVEFIRQAVENLATLVNDLLDLAKIDAGRLDVHAEQFEIDTLLRSLHGTLRPLLTNEKVRLVIEARPDLPELETDEGKVSQILRNLVSNAIKFTAEGEVRVTVENGPAPSHVAFSVADTGVGIAEADRERIFDEFVQIEGAHQVGVRGTGLGLPVSRKLAELLGGTITVRSAVGRGSVFTLLIPAIHPSAARDDGEGGAERDPRSPATQGPSPASHPRWTVLVVDDDPAARYLVRSMLRDVDCRIVEAEGGVIGLTLAGRVQPHLIVLDLQMPDMGGTEVLRRLRSDPAIPAIPVVVNTSRSLDEAERAAIEDLGATIVTKNAPEAETLASLMAALAEAPGGRTSDVGMSRQDPGAAGPGVTSGTSIGHAPARRGATEASEPQAAPESQEARDADSRSSATRRG